MSSRTDFMVAASRVGQVMDLDLGGCAAREFEFAADHGSGTPRSRQILRARKRLISVWRGTAERLPFTALPHHEWSLPSRTSRNRGRRGAAAVPDVSHQNRCLLLGVVRLAQRIRAVHLQRFAQGGALIGQ